MHFCLRRRIFDVVSGHALHGASKTCSETGAHRRALSTVPAPCSPAHGQGGQRAAAGGVAGARAGGARGDRAAQPAVHVPARRPPQLPLRPEQAGAAHEQGRAVGTACSDSTRVPTRFWSSSGAPPEPVSLPAHACMRNALHGGIAAVACMAPVETRRAGPQDFARLHGYDIVATSIVADPSLPHAWNKIGWLLRAYRVRGRPGRCLGGADPGAPPWGAPWRPGCALRRTWRNGPRHVQNVAKGTAFVIIQ